MRCSANDVHHDSPRQSRAAGRPTTFGPPTTSFMASALFCYFRNSIYPFISPLPRGRIMVASFRERGVPTAERGDLQQSWHRRQLASEQRVPAQLAAAARAWTSAWWGLQTEAPARSPACLPILPLQQPQMATPLGDDIFCRGSGAYCMPNPGFMLPAV